MFNDLMWLNEWLKLSGHDQSNFHILCLYVCKIINHYLKKHNIKILMWMYTGLFHIMAWFYVIYWYVISESRSIRPVEINKYDLTMATHYDIIMGNDVARDVHCEITMVNDIARDIHCDITMSNNVAMCTYHDITMHNDVAMNLFYYVFSAQCLIVILLWLAWNKNKNKFMLDQSGLENTVVVFV